MTAKRNQKCYYDNKNNEYINNNIANFHLIMLNLIETFKIEEIDYSIANNLKKLKKYNEDKLIEDIQNKLNHKIVELEMKLNQINNVNKLKDYGYIFSLGIVKKNYNKRLNRLKTSQYLLERYKGMIAKVISQYHKTATKVYYDYNLDKVMNLKNAEEYFEIIKELEKITRIDEKITAEDIQCYEDIEFIKDYDKIKLNIYRMIKDMNISTDKVIIKDILEIMMLSDSIDQKEKEEILYYYKVINNVEYLKSLASHYQEGVPTELRTDLSKYSTISIKEEEELENKIIFISEEREKRKLNNKKKRKIKNKKEIE